MGRFLIFFLFLSIQAIGQTKTYVLLDSENYESLFQFEKSESYAKLKILDFESKEKGFEKPKDVDENRFIVVHPIPNEYYYEFNSDGKPYILKSIKNIEVHSIEEISKHKLWNKISPHSIYFMEKVKGEYFCWKMNPVIRE